MIAVGLVIVHADPGGQRQRFEDAPLVFEEQRILAGGGFAAGTAGQVDRIAQLIVTPFAAKGHQLINRPQRQHVFAVDGVTLRSDITAIARILVDHLFAVILQFAVT